MQSTCGVYIRNEGNVVYPRVHTNTSTEGEDTFTEKEKDPATETSALHDSRMEKGSSHMWIVS